MIIDGKKIASEIQEELKLRVAKFSKRKPCLAAVLVGEHPASMIYVKRKVEACQAVGITSLRLNFPKEITREELSSEIQKLNQSPNVDGILLQLPLPSHINPYAMIHLIDPKKDVDGFNPVNLGKLLVGDKGFIPCTPLGIKVLLEKSNIDVSGKHVVVLGRSMIVGKPVAALMLNENATVTTLHSKSLQIQEICRQADILIVAIGKAKFLTADMVKPGAVVIDVGINRLNDTQKIVGDADFENLLPLCSAITPVPGGVGPMTIAMLLSNTVDSYELNLCK